MTLATTEQPTVSKLNCKNWHVDRGYTDPYCPRCAERVASGLAERFSTPAEIAAAKYAWRNARGVVARVSTKSREFKQSASRKGSHNRWHKDRGIVNPDCAHCVAEVACA